MALRQQSMKCQSTRETTNLVLVAADNKLSLGQDVTHQAPAVKQAGLPNTGSKETNSLISLWPCGRPHITFAFGKREKNNK